MGGVPQTIETPQLTPTSLPSTIQEAYDGVVGFFTARNEGNYDQAVDLYGGIELRDSTLSSIPPTGPGFGPGLVKNACCNV